MGVYTIGQAIQRSYPAHETPSNHGCAGVENVAATREASCDPSEMRYTDANRQEKYIEYCGLQVNYMGDPQIIKNV